MDITNGPSIGCRQSAIRSLLEPEVLRGIEVKYEKRRSASDSLISIPRYQPRSRVGNARNQSAGLHRMRRESNIWWTNCLTSSRQPESNTRRTINELNVFHISQNEHLNVRHGRRKVI